MIEFTVKLHDVLSGYVLPGATTPYFARVFKGEPNSLMPTSQAMARWRVKSISVPPEGPRVISGLMMRTAVFGVMCVWPLSATEEAQGRMEDEITTVAVDLPPLLCVPALDASEYTVGGVPVSALTVEDIQPIEPGFATVNAETMYRLFSFDVHARLLEES